MHNPGRDPEWGDPINAYTKWVIAALVTLCVLFVGIPMATAHQSVIDAPGIVTWTHGDHANDPIGVLACIQNQHGLIKCIDHNNRTYQFTGPYPQVPPNPQHAGKQSLLTVGPPVGYEWFWTKVGPYPGFPQAVCVYDWRKYIPAFIPLPTTFFEVACLNADQTTFPHPQDKSVDGTIAGVPDAGMVKEDIGTTPPPPPRPPRPRASPAPP